MALQAIAPTAPMAMPVQTFNSQPATKTGANSIPAAPKPGAPITMTSPTSGVPNLPNAPLPSSQPSGGATPLPPVGDPKTLPSVPPAPTYNPNITAPKSPTPTPQTTGSVTPSSAPVIPETAPTPLPTGSPALPSASPSITAPPLPAGLGASSGPVALNTGSLTGSSYTGPTPSSVGALSSYMPDTSSVPDRVKIAQNLLANFDPETEAKYRDDLRSATGQAAGLGQLGSGMWRTALGNVANDRATQRDAYERDLIQAATQGSIDDFYKNVGIAQQQQGFAADQQNAAFAQSFAQRQQDLAEKVASGQLSAQQAQLAQNALNSDRSYALQSAAQALQAQIANGQLTYQQAILQLQTQAQMFGQSVTQEQLAAYLQNQSFNQGLSLLGIGSQGNPSDYALAESGYYGNQANAASSSAAQLAALAAQRNGGNTTTNNYGTGSPYTLPIDPTTGLPTGVRSTGPIYSGGTTSSGGPTYG